MASRPMSPNDPAVQVMKQNQYYTGGAIEEMRVELNYDPKTRNDFVRKVFALILMMFILCGVIAGVMNLPFVKDAILETRVAYLVIAVLCSFILMALQYAFACSPCSKSPPMCYMLLFLTAAAAGGLVGIATMTLSSWLILCAVAVTVLIIMVCFGLAYSSFDFTKFLIYIIVVLLAISGCILVTCILKFALKIELKPLHITLLVLSVVAHAVLLIMELQLILGGKKYQLQENEYAYGASLVFMSILVIFLNLLGIARLSE